MNEKKRKKHIPERNKVSISFGISGISLYTRGSPIYSIYFSFLWPWQSVQIRVQKKRSMKIDRRQILHAICEWRMFDIITGGVEEGTEGGWGGDLHSRAMAFLMHAARFCISYMKCITQNVQLAAAPSYDISWNASISYRMHYFPADY